MKKTILVLLFITLPFAAFAGTKKAKVKCTFSEGKKTELAIDLTKKVAKQLNNQNYEDFPIYGDLSVVSHTSLSGQKLTEFNQIVTRGNGVKVMENQQTVLMGNNSDDSDFTLIISSSKGECVPSRVPGGPRACSETIVKAILISYWDGLDGRTDSETTDKCTITF